jgi:hypothetical protein
MIYNYIAFTSNKLEEIILFAFNGCQLIIWFLKTISLSDEINFKPCIPFWQFGDKFGETFIVLHLYLS